MKIHREGVFQTIKAQASSTERLNAQEVGGLEEQSIQSELRAEERKAIIQMRSRWSFWILASIIAITLFDFFIVFCLGLGILHFDQQFIIPAFIGESLIKTIGLAYIVVNFLFNKDSIG